MEKIADSAWSISLAIQLIRCLAREMPHRQRHLLFHRLGGLKMVVDDPIQASKWIVMCPD
jgi:hypothetical protein